MKRISLLALCGFLIISAALGNGRNASHPNILFILADDLGYAEVGYVKTKPEIITPSIDKLASGGVVFTNAYAACPVCSPTRASILTGKSPAALDLTCHIPGMGMKKYIQYRSKGKPLMEARFIDRLPLEEITIAELLREEGYQTGFFGKWHLAGEGSQKTKDGMVAPEFHPDKQGFDVNFGGNAYGQPASYFSPYGNGTLKDGEEGEYLSDRLTSEAINFMDKSSDPFFCYLSYYTVHEPHQAPRHLIAKNKGNRHHAMISSLDYNVGRLLEFLEQNDLDKNTLVIFYSDNGGLRDNPPLRDRKGSLYEGGIRVPLVLSYPTLIKAGTATDTPVSSYDFLPTLAELAGIPIDKLKGLEGESLVRILEGKKMKHSRPLFWHFPHHRNNKMSMAAAVREGDWKLIYQFEDQQYSLFNLKEDIGETTNLARSHPEKAKQLRKKLEKWQQKVKANFPQKNKSYSNTK